MLSKSSLSALSLLDPNEGLDPGVRGLFLTVRSVLVVSYEGHCSASFGLSPFR